MPTKATNYEDLYSELMVLASRLLVKGGILVFLYPIDKEKWVGSE